MKLSELNLLPDWPALMDVDVANAYLSKKTSLLRALLVRGYLEYFTDRKRCVTFRREDIDTALAIAKANEDDLELGEGEWKEFSEKRNLEI